MKELAAVVITIGIAGGVFLVQEVNEKRINGAAAVGVERHVEFDG